MNSKKEYIFIAGLYTLIQSIGVGTAVGLIIGAFALPWFISIPLFVLFGCAASSMAGSKYDEYFR